MKKLQRILSVFFDEIVDATVEYEEEWGAKDRFMKQLRRFASVKYEASHDNADFVKKLSAIFAASLMFEHTNWTPIEKKRTKTESFRDIASFLYQIAYPSSDVGPVLKRACDEVLKELRKSKLSALG